MNASGPTRRLSGLLVLALLASVLSLGAPPAAAASPELGAKLYSTGDPFTVRILGGSALITSSLYLVEPEEVYIGTNRDWDQVVELGPYPAGEELVFSIRYTGVEFFTGPAERNPDGIVHAGVQFTAGGGAWVGFEDLLGGGDFDYDDNNYEFTNIASSPGPPPLVADAGEDQSAPENSIVQLEGSAIDEFGTGPEVDLGPPSDDTFELPNDVDGHVHYDDKLDTTAHVCASYSADGRGTGRPRRENTGKISPATLPPDEAGSRVDHEWVQLRSDAALVYTFPAPVQTVDVVESIVLGAVKNGFTVYGIPFDGADESLWIAADVTAVFNTGPTHWFHDDDAIRWDLGSEYTQVGLKMGGPKTRFPDAPTSLIDGVCTPDISQGSTGPSSLHWDVIATDGPPIQLIGADTATPSFEVVDDGVYTVRLTATSGDRVAVDDVVVTVDNQDPVVGIQTEPTVNDGLTMITLSVNDPGIADTHTATIDWGDGSTSNVDASVQGTGWATIGAAHVYEVAGSYAVLATVFDDDGGAVTSASTVLEIPVGGAPVAELGSGIAIWGDAEDSDAVKITGDAKSVFGVTHSNGGIKLSGEDHVFTGPTEYVSTLTNSESATFDPAPVAVEPADRPIEFVVADYSPGSANALAAGDEYFDLTDFCGQKGFDSDGNGKQDWKPQEMLESGLYYAPCDVHLRSRSFADGPITIVSTGRIHVNGKAGDHMEPFADSLLLLTRYSGNQDSVKVTANESSLDGFIISNHGTIAVSGSSNSFGCALIAEDIEITGGWNSFDSTGCGSFDTGSGLSDGVGVAATPFVVPDLALGAESPETVTPDSAYDVTATLTATGVRVVVPGLVALSNARSDAADVQSATYELQRFDDASETWTTVVSSVEPTVSVTAIGTPMPNVSYPTDGGFVGTSVGSAGVAVWSVVAAIDLTPAEYAALVDPLQTPALRSAITLDRGADLGTRQTTRFGHNILDALSLSSASVQGAKVHTRTPAGPTAEVDLGAIDLGQSASGDTTLHAAPIADRRADESEAAYLARLQQAASQPSASITTGSATAVVGPVYAPSAVSSTGVLVPVIRVSASQPAGVSAGSTATWVLTLSNTGSASASADMVINALGQEIVPIVPDVAPGASTDVVVEIPVGAAQSESFTVVAEISWSDPEGASYGTLSRDVPIRIIAPTVLVVEKVGDIGIAGGVGAHFLITIENTGNDPVDGIVLVDNLDSDVSVLSDSLASSPATVQASSAGSLVEAQIGTLGAGEVATVSFSVDATSMPVGQTVLSNQAVVTADGLAAIPSDDPALAGVADPTVVDFGFPPGGAVDGGGIGDIDGPIAGNFSPANGDVITEPTVVSATITPSAGSTVEAWSAIVYPSGGSPAEGIEMGSGTGAPTELGELDATVLRNGGYTIRVAATDSEGRTRFTTTSFIVDGFLKLGRYSTTYLDSQVTVGGTPLQVLRTYDTLDRAQSGDFGHGWNLDVGNFRVDTNRALGLGQWTTTACGGGLIFTDLCWQSSPDNYVTVSWPDGRTESFDLTPKGNSFINILATAEYTARAGATSILRPDVGDGSITISDFDGHFHSGGFGSGPIYNPTRFILEAQDGTEYLLDVNDGLVMSTDRDGNTVTISDNGIVSSLGPAMTFTRDAEDRITTVTEPDGDTITYVYDAAGDLVSVTDQKAAISTFAYDSGHYLTEIDDPGPGAQRTLTYDADGRLSGITDANGNTTTVSVDPDARTEIVTDPDGNLTTVSTFDERGNATTVDEIYDGSSHVSVFEYNADDLVTSRTDPEGNNWTATYDDDENLIEFVDAEGNTSTFTYDEFGFPLTVTDADGQVTTFTYDGAGNIASITDARGGVQMFTYDGNGNQVTRTDQVGRVWEWAYNAESRLTEATDPRGNATTYTYDDNGQVATMTAADGGVTAYGYDGVGNLTSVTDPLSRTTNYAYDGRDLLTSVTDPSGAATAYTYDGVGRVLTRTDPTSRVWRYSYAFDRLATETAPDGGVTAYTYDGAGRVGSMTVPLSRTTTYGYDGAHRRTEVISPIDIGGTATTATFYDGNGRVESVTNAESETTAYSYDGLGRLESITDPIGRTTTYGYDPTGNRTSVTNAEAETTNWVFDLAGQLSSVTNAESEATSYTYDLAGNLETVSDPLARVTTYGYDAVNRRDSVTVPSGDSGSTVFDLAGQVTTSTSPAGYTSTYTYDPRGLVASITDELGNSQASAYDPAGRLTTATDGRGNDTTFAYDANGRLESETDPLGGSVSFGYDFAGQRISVTDPNSATRGFGFDDGGRMITATDAENRVTAFAYDAVGRRIGMTDARGVTVMSTFDDAGQLIGQVSPNETRSFSYDLVGRRTQMVDASGTTAMVFDDVGRLTEVTTAAGTVGYGFNAAGEQITMTQPEGTVTSTYDVNGFLAGVSDWRGDTFTMVNDADGRMETVARSNGVDTAYGYDLAGRLTSIGHSSGATLVDSFTYSLDGNGNRTGVTSNAGAEVYTLDSLNRITAATYPGGLSETFSYDAAGNRTSHTDTAGVTVGFTVDATGQLVSDTTGATYSYDDAGNLTATSSGDVFVYDDFGRMTSATANGTTQTYGYDAAGVRVDVDGTGQLWDRNGLPTLISTAAGDSYVHAAGVSRDGDDWLLADAVGSVRATVDNTGATVGSQDFTVYGEQLTGTGTFGFAGEQADPTGLIHLRARQYNPAVGRFTSVDPVQPGAPATTGWNLYTYAGNNPTTWGDPSGRAVLAEYGKLVAKRALVGAAIGGATSFWTCDQSGNAWYEPGRPSDLDGGCVATEIALGAIFGAIGGAGAGKGASAGRIVSVACAWGAVEGGTGAALHAEVQGQQQSAATNGLSAAFGCISAGLLAGRINAWSGGGPRVGVEPPRIAGEEHIYSSGGSSAQVGNSSPARMTVDEARAAAEAFGVDTRSIEIVHRTEGMPGYWDQAFGSTPMNLNPSTLASTPIRAGDGRFIVELQNAGLQSPEIAAMTIKHELQHLRQWVNGRDMNELDAERAAELLVNWFRG